MNSNVVVVDNFLHKVVQKQIETSIINDSSISWNYWHNASYKNINELQFCQNDPDIFVKRFGNLSHVLISTDGSASDFCKSLPDLKKTIETKFNVKIKKMLRSRINLTFPIGEVTDKYDTPHWDLDPPRGNTNCKSVVYYVNDTDGDTVLFEEMVYNDNSSIIDTSKKTLVQRISPKQGRAIMFDANRYHAGSFPSKNIRIVLNINLLLEDE